MKRKIITRLTPRKERRHAANLRCTDGGLESKIDIGVGVPEVAIARRRVVAFETSSIPLLYSTASNNDDKLII